MFKLYLITLIFFPATLFAQILSGKVYDAESTVNGAKIINLTQNFMVYADEYGNFKLEAQVNDQIAITTLFHEPQVITVSLKDFDDVMVIELKKKVNELDQVYLNKIKEKKFDLSEAENSIASQMKSDVELRPWLYEPPPNLNMDFKAIAGLIAKLFKKRELESPKMLTYGELKDYLKSNSFFNEKFLIADLHIEKEYHLLFIDFCEVKGIDKKLLLKENQLLLVDTFVQYSEEFSVFIKNLKKN